MCTVYTSRIGYQGMSGLDITVKSAQGIGQILAPTWELVGGYKGWRGYTSLTEQEYTDGYLALLRTRYQSNAQPFIDIIEREQVVLLCYCRSGAFYHRHIALTVLDKIAHAKAIPFNSGGELHIHERI